MRHTYKVASIASLLVISLPLMASGLSDEGYYGSLKLLRTFQQAKSMDTSSRPGIGSFVAGEDRDNFFNGAVAAGYQYGNGWRTEAEYTFKRNTSFTSGSTQFPTSFNHHNARAQRLMFNAYRDYDLTHGLSVYATAGLGLAKVKTGGWQGNTARQYAENSDDNLAWSLGAGVSWTPVDRVSIDLGYRYVDMGKAESGWNNFTNARGLQDEQLKARLVNQEYTLGLRYLF